MRNLPSLCTRVDLQTFPAVLWKLKLVRHREILILNKTGFSNSPLTVLSGTGDIVPMGGAITFIVIMFYFDGRG